MKKYKSIYCAKFQPRGIVSRRRVPATSGSAQLCSSNARKSAIDVRGIADRRKLRDKHATLLALDTLVGRTRSSPYRDEATSVHPDYAV